MSADEQPELSELFPGMEAHITNVRRDLSLIAAALLRDYDADRHQDIADKAVKIYRALDAAAVSIVTDWTGFRVMDATVITVPMRDIESHERDE